MDENEFVQELYYNFLEYNKYIIIYIDNNLEINNDYYNVLKIINKNSSIKIVRFLLNSEEKNNYKNIFKDSLENNLLINEIYPDSYIEDILIKNCLFIIYLSSIIRSNQLIELVLKYNKLIVYNINIIDSYIFSNIENILQNNIQIVIDNFIQNYNINEINENLKDNGLNKICNNNNNNLINKTEIISHPIKNIKYTINKSLIINNTKINIVTFFKNSDVKILNVIQKKCIIENLKNNNIDKLIIIGKNLQEELNDINNENKNIIFIEYPDNLSYSTLIKLINEKLNDEIVCILRSDIVLPNQQSLNELEIDFYENKNEIYSVSRIERLINGIFVKSEKLNKILFSSEQDAWIFKAPLKIDYTKLENIYFYNKYSELYFNYILKVNNYNLINNTNKFKIIRILYENNIENRILIQNNKINYFIKDPTNNSHNIYLLPDNNSIDKISIENLINSLKLDDKEIYNIKCDLFNKYFKNRIISDL